MLRVQLEEMQKKSNKALVDTSLASLQLLISKPQALFDPYAAIAALEHLVDCARECGDDRSNCFRVVLRQCRPLIQSPALQFALIKLVADKEDAEVSKVVENKEEVVEIKEVLVCASTAKIFRQDTLVQL